jgi:hypothetical protein
MLRARLLLALHDQLDRDRGLLGMGHELAGVGVDMGTGIHA